MSRAPYDVDVEEAALERLLALNVPLLQLDELARVRWFDAKILDRPLAEIASLDGVSISAISHAIATASSKIDRALEAESEPRRAMVAA